MTDDPSPEAGKSGARRWVALAPIIAVAVSIWLAYLPLRPRWKGNTDTAPTTSATSK